MAVKEKKTATNEYSKEIEDFKGKETKDDKKTKEKKSNVKKKKTEKKEVVKKGGPFRAIGRWFRGVAKEVSNVRWPNKKEMIKYSVATIFFVLFFAIFFLIIEIIMSFLLSYFG